MVPCYRSDWGWWSAGDNCYYVPMSPQPGADQMEWGSHYPDGALYEARCGWSTGGPVDIWDYLIVWFASSPPGTPVTPAELAQRAVDRMTLLGPDIRTTPQAGAMGLVGLPVWLWTPAGATRWGPNSATATVPGLSVTATARATKIVWQMGDGTTVVCHGPGTAYSPTSARTTSPDCGHVYLRSSARRPGHVYTVTATTTWSIRWAGGGQAGALTRTRTSTAQLRVGELQVLVR